jgi:hypothetical protein
MRTKCWLEGFGNVDIIKNLMNAFTATDLLWFVAHTRPRCEKKFVQFCERDGLFTTLPCHCAVHKYRGKTVVFQKPLFPGYVFRIPSNWPTFIGARLEPCPAPGEKQKWRVRDLTSIIRSFFRI